MRLNTPSSTQMSSTLPCLRPAWQCEGCQAQSESNGGGVALAQMDHCAPAPRVRQEIICRDRQSLKADTDLVG